MTSVSATRIPWIDEFKGFVLLLVCLFHVEQSFTCVSMGMNHLSAMRMSAFFFISGVLFSTRKFTDFKSYAIHKTRVLLLPYIFLSLLFLALDPVVWHFEWFSLAPKMTIMNIRPEIASLGDYLYWNFIKIFVVGKSSIGSGPLWFVFTLYSISLLFFFIQKLPLKISSQSSLQKIFIAIMAVASLAAGWILFKNHIRLPFGIERDLTTLSFFAAGWLCKDFIKKLNSLKTIPLVTATILTFAFYGAIDEANPWFSIMNNDLGKSLPRFVASSFLGIAGSIGFFQITSRFPQNKAITLSKGILRNISRNALVILAVHWWVLLVIRIAFKQKFNQPGIAYLTIPIVAVFSIAAIPLFRNKLYKLLGKEKISAKESLSVR